MGDDELQGKQPIVVNPASHLFCFRASIPSVRDKRDPDGRSARGHIGHTPVTDLSLLWHRWAYGSHSLMSRGNTLLVGYRSCPVFFKSCLANMSLCNRYYKCFFFFFLFRGERLHYFLLQWLECIEIFIFLPLTPWKLLFSVTSLEDTPGHLELPSF